MNDKASAFGANPEQIDKLLAWPLDEDPEGLLAVSVEPFVEDPEEHIGCYKLLRLLDEGGMGMIYLARQAGAIRRKVALKVIKPGMDSERVIARFETERQALALLDHPNIAQVYDAGTTGVGRPYFVMEYVKGLPITKYCDRHRLTIQERLRLFQQVCHAVHHAHQKGIIHRDIKPSNILVPTEGDHPVPKIIDFGVAKAISQPLTERTLFTEDSQLLGTPEYMSPEQADMASEDIDTRSDIYSLGVLLYVLLAGILPFDPETFRHGGIEHVRRVIRETDPKTPSARLMKLGDRARRLALRRRTELSVLTKCLQRELEWIPLKAMRKDRAERYRSASELADDIDNYIKGAPLIAGPPTARYRLRKFLRRHKALVAASAAVLVISVIGTIVSVTFALGQMRARAEAQAIADFLTGVLSTAAQGRTDDAAIISLLDTASNNIEVTFRGRPLTEASVHEMLGQTYRTLTQSAKAEQHWLRALQIYQEHRGLNHPATLRAKRGLYWVYDDQERHYDAERLQREILQVEVSARQAQYLGDMGTLAHTYHHLGRYAEAESLYDRMFAMARAQEGEDGVRSRPFAACNLARVYADQGRYGEAELLFLSTLETAQWGAESRWRLMYEVDLANMYRDQGNYAHAERLLKKTVETQRRVLGDGHKFTLHGIYSLARVHMALEAYDDAEALLDEGLRLGRSQLRDRHPATLRFVNALGVLYTERGLYAKAEERFDEAFEGRRYELGIDHPETLETLHDLAMLHLRLLRYNKAEELLRKVLDSREAKLGPGHPHTVASLTALIGLYEAQEGKSELAERFRARLSEATSGQERN